MFAGEHVFVLPNKIGEVQQSLLKKRISQNGGMCDATVTWETTRIISNLPNVLEISHAISPSQLHPSIKIHSTDWISKALIRGSKCSDEVYLIPRGVTSPTKESVEKPNSIGRKTSHGSLQTSNDSIAPAAEGLVRRSSSKTKFSEMNFGDPSFGLKTKPPVKKQTKGDDESPPERTSSKHEEQADSFARHLIRKRVKYSELDNDEIHRTLLDPPAEAVKTSSNFELTYNLSDSENSDCDRRHWSLLSDSTSKICLPGLSSPNKALTSSTAPQAENDDENTQPCSIPQLDLEVSDHLPKRSETKNMASYKPKNQHNGEKEEEIWFTGSELPRVLEGVRATEEDDIEDPKFYALLKPAAGLTDKALEDEIRYQGPWADRLRRQLSASINEAFEDDDEHVSVLKGAISRNGSTRSPEKPVDDDDSQENDFSESQVAFDLSDFKKNFGHSHKTLSPYWERQRENLACQKLPADRQAEAASTVYGLAPVKVNHNKLVTDQLEKLEQICLGSGDRWRGYAYRKAANILKSLTYKIESTEEALKLRGIGTSIAEKIGEIISTGKLRKLDALQNEERIQVLSTFMGIFGVGQSTANKWCAMGYKTLEDLQKNATLTYAQAVGLKFYDDFKLRIPRAEMETICGAIKKVITKIDADFIVEICGSYRRGKPDCGDIDIIITHKRPNTLKNILHQAVPLLHQAKILTHDFVTIAEGSDKYMGVCQASQNSTHRRIDMLTVPPAEWPFALLYFTGSGHFNRSMRFWAGKRGYSLSQHGLRVNYGNDNKGPYIAGITTEKQVFEALGLEYRPPEDRDV